jgi:hypothetical protein
VIDYAKRSKRNASLIHLIAEKWNSGKSAENVYPCGIEHPEGAPMDDETMQLLKVLREQLGKTSASRSVDALAAANSLGLESGSLEFHRRLHDLLRAKYLEEAANPALSAQGKYVITFEGLAAADNH